LRTVLAVLAISAGRDVTIDRLAEAVWDERHPGNARRAIQLYVTRLRAFLGSDSIRTVAAGYRLQIDPERVDAIRFTRTLEDAATADDVATQRLRLVQALALWRGRPFDGIRSSWLDRIESPRLVELHVEAVERRVDLDLAAGLHGRLVAELRELIAQHPLRERLWAQLMTALYRSGRQAEALEVYQQLYRISTDELGVEPTPTIRELHHRILTGDPLSCDSGTDPPVSTPRQLPAAVARFAGRSDYFDRLDTLLAENDDGATVVIAAIAGTAGVGKTALAVHWAHRIADRFPDGQLYVNLRGFDPSGVPMTPTDAVRGFLDAFAVPPHRVPASLDAQAALYRSVLASKRVLVVLDNARDAEQVRPLLPGAPGCLALITSRNQLTSLVAAEGAHSVLLDVLPIAEARELLARRLGADRVAADPDVVEQIVIACARLPLALSIAAARAQQTGFPLVEIAAELEAAGQRLDALDAGDAASHVRAVFSWSYTTLTAPAARLFRLLGMHWGPHIGTAAAASLAGVSPGRVRMLFAELARAHLVAEQTPARFALHDLLRVYAIELSQSSDSDSDRRAALHRMFDHYVNTAYAADRLIHPERDPIILPEPQTGTTPEELFSAEQALSWFATEHAVLVRSVGQAASTGFDQHTWRLAWTLTDSLQRLGLWHDQVDIQYAALDAGRRLADRDVQVDVHRSLARGYLRLGRNSDALSHVRDALDLSHELADAASHATTHLLFSKVLERMGRDREALGHARCALAIFRAAGNRHGQANSLNSVGWLHGSLLDHQRALSYCQQALALHEQIDNRIGAALTWDSLGYIRHHMGDYEGAIGDYRLALKLLRELGDRYTEAIALRHLGDSHKAAGDPDAARDCWRRALAILDELGHSEAEQVRALLDAIA
jgi:DNA-binding SARP family transcriptional activator